jgi:hypothetical protein
MSAGRLLLDLAYHIRFLLIGLLALLAPCIPSFASSDIDQSVTTLTTSESGLGSREEEKRQAVRNFLRQFRAYSVTWGSAPRSDALCYEATVGIGVQLAQESDVQNVFVCLTACHNGTQAMLRFCDTLPPGPPQTLCYTAALSGQAACEAYCRATFGPRPRPPGPSVPHCPPDQKLCGNSCIPAGDVCPQCPPSQKNCGTACIPAAMTCCQDSGCPPNADCCGRSCLYPGNLCCGNNRICGPNSECCISFGSMGCMPSGYVCCGATRENRFPTSCPAGSTCRLGGCDPS